MNYINISSKVEPNLRSQDSSNMILIYYLFLTFLDLICSYIKLYIYMYIYLCTNRCVCIFPLTLFASAFMTCFYSFSIFVLFLTVFDSTFVLAYKMSQEVSLYNIRIIFSLKSWQNFYVKPSEPSVYKKNFHK